MRKYVSDGFNPGEHDELLLGQFGFTNPLVVVVFQYVDVYVGIVKIGLTTSYDDLSKKKVPV